MCLLVRACGLLACRFATLATLTVVVAFAVFALMAFKPLTLPDRYVPGTTGPFARPQRSPRWQRSRRSLSEPSNTV